MLHCHCLDTFLHSDSTLLIHCILTANCKIFLFFSGDLPKNIEDHRVVSKLRNHVLMSMLAMIESVALGGREALKGTGGTGKGVDVEKCGRNVSALKVLACLLQDSVMLDETHVPVIGIKKSSTLTHTPIRRDGKKEAGGEGKGGGKREGKGGGEDGELSRPSQRVSLACPSSTFNDGCSHPVSATMLVTPNVSQMMSAVHFNNSASALHTHTHATQGMVFIPFTCSLSKVASQPTLSSHAHAHAHVSVTCPPSVSVSPTGCTSSTTAAGAGAGAFHPSVTPHRGDTQRQRCKDVTVSTTDTPFAMGISVVYTDELTPPNSVTVLTLAYHSADSAFTRTRAVDLSPHNSNPPPFAYTWSTSSVRPLQIEIPDLSSEVHLPVHIEHEEQNLFAKKVTQREKEVERVIEDGEKGEEGECVREKGEEEEEGKALRDVSVSPTRENATLESETSLLNQCTSSDLIPSDPQPISTPSSSFSPSPSSSISISASERNKSEGGLFGYVIEEMTYFTLDLFTDVTEQVHLIRGWNVLQRNFLTPQGSPTIRDRQIRSVYEELNTPLYLAPQINAWAQVRDVKLLLSFLIQRSKATPLHFLSFLQSPLLLIAKSLETFSGDVLQNRNIRPRTHTGGATESVCGAHDLLNHLVYNLSAAFRNRCRCFFERQNEIVENDKVSETGVNEGTEKGTETGTDQKADTDGDRDRDRDAGMKRRNVLHILISPPPSSSFSSSSSTHTEYTEGASGFAVHICIPSLSQQENSLSSTVKCRLKQKDEEKEKECRESGLLKSKSKRNTSDVSRKKKKKDISKTDKSNSHSHGKVKGKSSAVLPLISLIESYSGEKHSRHVREGERAQRGRGVSDIAVGVGVGVSSAEQTLVEHSEEKRREHFISQVVNVILYTVSSSV